MPKSNGMVGNCKRVIRVFIELVQPMLHGSWQNWHHSFGYGGCFPGRPNGHPDQSVAVG